MKKIFALIFLTCLMVTDLAAFVTINPAHSTAVTSTAVTSASSAAARRRRREKKAHIEMYHNGSIGTFSTETYTVMSYDDYKFNVETYKKIHDQYKKDPEPKYYECQFNNRDVLIDKRLATHQEIYQHYQDKKSLYYIAFVGLFVLGACLGGAITAIILHKES